MTYSDPIWYQVALVNNQDDLLVGFFLLDKFKNRLAKRSHRIPSIENVQNDVWGVDNFVEFTIDTPWSSFGVDGFNDIGMSLEFRRDGRGARFWYTERYISNGMKRSERNINIPPVSSSTWLAAASALSYASAPSWLNSSKVPTSKRGFFRWALGPKVSWKGSVSTMCERLNNKS